MIIRGCIIAPREINFVIGEMVKHFRSTIIDVTSIIFYFTFGSGFFFSFSNHTISFHSAFYI